VNTLQEQYRPKTLADLVGQDKVVGFLTFLEKRGLAGRAYWINGRSGTGKTTVARIIAEKVADDWATIEIDGDKLSVDVLGQIEEHARYAPLGKGSAWIINEAHRLAPRIIARLLVILEALSDHVTVIFTTTSAAQKDLFENQLDSGPLLSRCTVLELAQKALSTPFAKRAKEIAEKEGLGGAPLAAYIALTRKHKNNLRAILGEIETGATYIPESEAA